MMTSENKPGPALPRGNGWQKGVAFVTPPIALLTTVVLLSNAYAQSAALPEGEYQSVVRAKCTTCHVAAQVVAQRRSADQWAQVIESMILQGAQVNDQEFDQIVAYLTTHYGPEPIQEERASRCPSGGKNAD